MRAVDIRTSSISSVPMTAITDNTANACCRYSFDDEGKQMFCFCNKCELLDLSGIIETPKATTEVPCPPPKTSKYVLGAPVTSSQSNLAFLNSPYSQDNSRVHKRKTSQKNTLNPTTKGRKRPSAGKALAQLERALNLDQSVPLDCKHKSFELVTQLKALFSQRNHRAEPSGNFSPPIHGARNFSEQDSVLEGIAASVSTFDSFPTTTTSDSAHYTLSATSFSSGPGPTRSNPSLSGLESGRINRHRRPGRLDGPLFYCTYPSCGKIIASKGDWKRHEESEKHWPQKRFMCLDCITFLSEEDGTHLCVFCCSFSSPDLNVVKMHNLQCKIAQEQGTTFLRKDHFREHLREKHHMVNLHSQAEQWTYALSSEWPRECGFCGYHFSSWDERANHLETEFRSGLNLSSWRIPFRLHFEISQSQISGQNEDEDDDDDDEDEHRHHQGHHRTWNHGDFAQMTGNTDPQGLGASSQWTKNAEGGTNTGYHLSNIGSGQSPLELYLADDQRLERLFVGLQLRSPQAMVGCNPQPLGAPNTPGNRDQWSQQTKTSEISHRSSSMGKPKLALLGKPQVPFASPDLSNPSTSSVTHTKFDTSSHVKSGSSITSAHSSQASKHVAFRNDATILGGSQDQYDYDLPCEFQHIGCEVRYHPEELDEWIQHTISHFIKAPPPTNASCIFCSEYNQDLKLGEDKGNSWQDRMMHIYEHWRNGASDDDTTPAHDVNQYLEKSAGISEEDWSFAIYFRRLALDS